MTGYAVKTGYLMEENGGTYTWTGLHTASVSILALGAAILTALFVRGTPAAETAENAVPACFRALSIPVIELELPVLQTTWTDGKFDLALCCQFGAVEMGDLAIAGQNPTASSTACAIFHPATRLCFWTGRSRSTVYSVAKLETIAPDDIAAVQRAAYLLVLCTYKPGAKTHVAVYCNYA